MMHRKCEDTHGNYGRKQTNENYLMLDSHKKACNENEKKKMKRKG
jgi:hypothetical protein